MREHMGLFRGKRTDNGEWVYGSLIAPIYGAKPLILQNAAIDDSGCLEFDYYFVDPDTVGECTGLRDKNGKLIFEGDILLNKDCGKIRKYIVGYYAPFAMFMLNDEERHCGSNGMYTQLITCEIIGNIHDNPELLKGGEGDG